MKVDEKITLSGNNPNIPYKYFAISIISLIYHENTLTSSSKEFIKLITNKK